MSLSRHEALAAGRKLLRTFPSAPDPRARTRALCSELLAAADWSADERQAIVGLNEWVMNYPLTSELKSRCEQLLALLLKSPA